MLINRKTKRDTLSVNFSYCGDEARIRREAHPARDRDTRITLYEYFTSLSLYSDIINVFPDYEIHEGGGAGAAIKAPLICGLVAAAADKLLFFRWISVIAGHGAGPRMLWQ
ncbi:hypothetical protein EVAR_46197_1 [Eumeta japonica]|uniref:Uncharacterized protein n=1 Tax=Eumeta variegata TaxID=151549 RepID=A0A4C1WFK7_EUMVA|nr:hypothetical protein EVAR_46197_1 [Eumeta japonica]